MRRSTTVFSKNQSGPTITRRGLKFMLTAGLLAVTTASAVNSVNAKDPLGSDVKVTVKGSTVEVKTAESTEIPECIHKLKLSAEQSQKIREIVRSYDGSLNTVAKQFGERYMQTIAIESSLLAAIEDNLTEAQRMQVRDQRRKTAQHEKVSGTPHAKTSPAAGERQEGKSKTAAIVEHELAAVGITLTDEQEAAADKLHHKYQPRLRSMHREIHALHGRLVSLEADKLVEIEKVLTEAQLAELRASRQEAPAEVKVSISTTAPAKAE